MEHTDERKNTSATATIVGAVVTIGAVVLSNREVRMKLLRMISNGLDKLTAKDDTLQTTVQRTSEAVERKTKQALSKVKDTVDALAESDARKAQKAATAR